MIISSYLVMILILLSCNQKQQETCKYQAYYNEVTNALTEKHSNNNWTKANELFKSAFKKVKTPFGKDLEEALEISIKLKDEHQTQVITKKLLRGGIPIEHFNKYSSILKQNWWKKIDHAKIENEYKRNFNQELLNDLISLRTKDSLFNVEYHKFRKGELHLELDYLLEKSKGIYNEFKELDDTHGFPSEINTGYLYRNGKIQNLPTQVVLIHIHQLGEPIIKNEFTFEELVCNGHMTEFDYDQLIKTMSIGGEKGIEYEMKLFYKQYKNYD